LTAGALEIEKNIQLPDAAARHLEQSSASMGAEELRVGLAVKIM
jgi:hypothetical protein